MWNRRLFVCIAMVILVLGTSLIGDAGPQPLKVLVVTPSGETPRVRQFTVVFNQPMVALGDMAQAPDKSPVVITPDIEGRFRWLNVYTLAFEPKVPLEGSIKGEIIVKAGTTSLSGSQLEQEFKTEYSLPRIDLLNTDPNFGTGGLPLQPVIHVYFNQPLNPSEFEAKAHFFADDGTQIPGRLVDQDKLNLERRPGDPWEVAFVPAKDLPTDSGFELVVPAGLSSAVGPLPSDRNFRISFKTYGPLRVDRVTGHRAQSGLPFDPESGVQVVFYQSGGHEGRGQVSQDYSGIRPVSSAGPGVLAG